MSTHLSNAEQFEIAREAMASLELFARVYESSDPYQQHKATVAMIVNHAAQRSLPAGDNFLTRFASALDKI